MSRVFRGSLITDHVVAFVEYSLASNLLLAFCLLFRYCVFAKIKMEECDN